MCIRDRDKLFAWWVIVSVVFGSLSKPSMDLFINRLGDFYNAVGCYFFVRCVIVEFEDIVTSVQTLAWLSMAVAVPVSYTHLSGGGGGLFGQAATIQIGSRTFAERAGSKADQRAG